MHSSHKSNLQRNEPIALDYQSSTPCSLEVIAAMEPYWIKEWGNSSSRQNQAGLKAAAAVSVAREKIAECLHVKPDQIIFTSGATEANNIALLGHARAVAAKIGSTGHLITVKTEHRAVLDPLRQLKREGFHLTELQPNRDGLITETQLYKSIRKDTLMISIMAANNEIGVLHPLSNFTRLCSEKKITFHSDASQILGYIPFYPNSIGLDMASISGHKIYGPKGIGALIINKNLPIQPLQWGGGQETGIRPGTLPVPLIIGFSKAIEVATREINNNQHNLKTMRDYLLGQLKQELPNIQINGCIKNRLPHNLNITIPEIKGVKLYQRIRQMVNCSSGSACSAGEPSHVLMALGLNSEQAKASLRLSLGRTTSKDEIDKAISAIVQVVNELKK